MCMCVCGTVDSIPGYFSMGSDSRAPSWPIPEPSTVVGIPGLVEAGAPRRVELSTGGRPSGVKRTWTGQKWLGMHWTVGKV